MSAVVNITRCLVRGARRRRKKIFLSALIALTLWNLYISNNGNFFRDRLDVLPEDFIRKPQVEIETTLRLRLRLRGRTLGNHRLGRREELNAPIRADENDQKNRDDRIDLARLHHFGFKSKQDVSRYDSSDSENISLKIHSRRSKAATPSNVCKTFFLTDSNKTPYGTCKPHRAAPEACKFAESLYSCDPSLSYCKDNEESVEICSLGFEVSQKRKLLKAKCNSQACQRFVNKVERKFLTFGVHSIDPEEGVLRSVRNFSSVSELEHQLPRIALLTARNKFNFVFINCFVITSSQTLASQLVSIPPRVTLQEGLNPRAKNAINVNIVLLDSVSRAHFYRSLPKTVETLRSLADRPDMAPAKVYDFELFQAVHGHTTHNEHALFTGQLLPPMDPDEEIPSVRADVLFGHFKRAGYQTMWQEDLCWMSSWGLVTDLVAEDWEELQIKLKDSFIDNTGDNVKKCFLKPC